MDRRPLPRRRHALTGRPLERNETHFHLWPGTDRPRPHSIRPETLSGSRKRTREKSSLPSRSLHAPEASMNSNAPTNVFHPETPALITPSLPVANAQMSQSENTSPPCPPVPSVVKAFLIALCEPLRPLRFKIFVCLASYPKWLNVSFFVAHANAAQTISPRLRVEQLF